MNYGIHIIKYPTGLYGLVGTLPYELGNEAKPSKEDIMGGRFTTNQKGETVTIKFPTFNNVQDVITHVERRGHEVCQSRTCACHKLISGDIDQ